MPVVPTQLTPDRTPFAAGELRTEASPGAFAQPGEALAGAGEKAAAVGASFAEKYADATRQQQAAALTFQGINQLQQSSFKWSKVPNVEQAIAGFNSDAENIRGQTADQSSDPEVRALVSREILSHSTFLGLMTQRGAFSQQASQAQADLTDQLAGYSKMAATQDPYTRASTVDKATAAIRGAQTAGWIMPEAAAVMREKFSDQVWGDAVRQGLENNPAQTLADLKAGHYDDRLSIPMRRELQPTIDHAEGVGLGNGFYNAVGPQGGDQHNPGNIRVPGSSGAAAGAFQSFGSDAEGIAAIGRNLDAYQDQHGANTLRAIISRWAPPSENDTPALIRRAQQVTGLDPDQPLDVHDPETRAKLTEAIIRNEHGGQLTVDPALIGKAGSAFMGPLTSMSQASAPQPLEDVAAELQRRADKGEISQNVADIAMRTATQRYTRWKQATNTARAGLEQNIKDGVAALADGRDWQPPANMGQLLQPDQIDAVNREIGEARDAGQAKTAVQFASPDEISQLQARALGRLDQPGAPDYERSRRYATQLGAAIDNHDKALNADPAAFAAQSPVVQQAWQQARQAGGNAEAPIAASLAEQQRLGVAPENQRVLSKPEAAQLVRQITSDDAGAGDLAAGMDKISQSYGRYWNQAFGDLVKAGLPPQYQVMAALDHPEQVVGAGDMQRMLNEAGIKGGMQKLKDAAPEQEVKSIDQNLAGQVAPLMATIPDPMLGAVWKDAVKNLATYYAYRGQDGNTALKNAWQNVIGARYDFDGALRVPKGQLSTVQQAGDAVVRGITPEQLAPAPSSTPLTPEQGRAAYLDAIRRGYWQTNESGDGAVLYLPWRNGLIAPARKADGSRIEFKFADAANILAKASPAPLPAATPGIQP